MTARAEHDGDPRGQTATVGKTADQLLLEREKELESRWQPLPPQNRAARRRQRVIPTRHPRVKAPPEYPAARRKPPGKRRGYDPHRRRKWLGRAGEIKTPGAVMRLCVWLAEHSNDGLKPVWGAQVTMAKDLGVNVRTIRRWVELLKAAGLIVVEEAELIRDPDTGQIKREHANTYWMVFPAVEAATAGVEALQERRRQQRLGWAEKRSKTEELAAVIAAETEHLPSASPTGHARPHNPPFGEVNPPGPSAAKVGAGDNAGPDSSNPENRDSAVVREARAAARAALGKTPRP